MKSILICVTIIFLILLVHTSCTQRDSLPVLKGSYLGQKPPGMTLEIFAPGIVTTDKSEWAITVSPDLQEIYFSRRTPGESDHRIWYSRVENGKLTIPEQAPFTYNCYEAYPCFTHDGKRLYFISQRPLPGEEVISKTRNIWFIDKTEDGWGEPELLNSPINDYNPFCLSLETNGTLYFTGSPGALSDEVNVPWAIYYVELKDGEYLEAKRLPDEINYLTNVAHPEIARDGSYIMIDSYWRENNRMNSFAYISFKKPDGTWTKAVSMRKVLKASESDNYCSARITPDGKYMFFKKSETGKSDLYWISADVIEKLKPDEKNTIEF